MPSKILPGILVVEDEFFTSMELEEMLKENGYHVMGLAGSGEEAIAMAECLNPDLSAMILSSF